LENLVSEGDDEMPFFHLGITETEIRICGLDDFLDHTCDFSLEICHFYVVLDDVLEGHYSFRELLRSLEVFPFSNVLPSQLAGLLRHLPLPNKLLKGTLLALALHQREVLVVIASQGWL
jgi:hypothetical protein